MGKGAASAGRERPRRVGQVSSGGQGLAPDDQGQVELAAGHGRGRLGDQADGDRPAEARVGAVVGVGAQPVGQPAAGSSYSHDWQ